MNRIRLSFKQRLAGLEVLLIDLMVDLVDTPEPIRRGLKSVWVRPRTLESFINRSDVG